MLPINSLDKCLFIFLYNFANIGKLHIYILAIYIAISIEFEIFQESIDLVCHSMFLMEF